jgi:excisionase family DNA binding protein
MEVHMEQLACSIADASTTLCVSRGTIYNWIAAGRIQAVKVGGRRLINVASLRQLVSRENEKLQLHSAKRVFDRATEAHSRFESSVRLAESARGCNKDEAL